MRRTMLFVPANNAQFLKKSTEVDADAIIFDLEDSVPLSQKKEARETLSKALSNNDWPGKELCVRVNSPSTEVGLWDLLYVAGCDSVDAVVVPKAEHDLSFVHTSTAKKIIPIIESASGLLNITQVAQSDGVTALMYGPADFANSVNGDIGAYSTSSVVKTLVACHAAMNKVDSIDSVYFDVKNTSGLRKEAKDAKKLGFSGKAVIHPDQVAVVNQIFYPTKEELARFRRIVQAYESTGKRGAITVDGKLVDYAHYKWARNLLQKLSEGE